MKISVIILQTSKKTFSSYLSRYANSHKDVEFIIYSHSSDQLHIETDKTNSNIKRFSCLPLSTSFIYNRAIRIASAPIIGIIPTNFTTQTANSLSKVLPYFNADPRACVVSSFPLLQLSLSKKTHTLNTADFSLLIKSGIETFFFRKDILEKEGLFFDESLSSLGNIDLSLRAIQHHYHFITLQSHTHANIASYHPQLGNDIDRFLIKYGYRKNTFFYLLYSLSLAHVVPYKILTSYVSAWISRRMYNWTKKFATQANMAWISFCKSRRLSRFIFFPKELAIEPTNICNARCPLCPTGSKQLKRPKGYMDFRLFKKIIDETKYCLNNIILWNLGESFLNPDIFSMIQYAHLHGIRITASTNGYPLYTISSINQIIESQIDELIVSADGVDQKTVTLYRKGTNFTKLVQGMKYLRDRKKVLNSPFPITKYQFILMKQTQNQIEKARELAKKLEAIFVIKFVNLEMVNLNNKSDFLPDKFTHRKYTTKNHHVEMKLTKKNTPCVLWDGVVVNWDGSVNPCLFDYYAEIDLGNVSNKPLIPIWRGNRVRQLKQNILRDKSVINICQKCPINENYAELFYE